MRASDFSIVSTSGSFFSVFVVREGSFSLLSRAFIRSIAGVFFVESGGFLGSVDRGVFSKGCSL